MGKNPPTRKGARHRRPKPFDLHNIAENMRALRGAMGWSQEQLAEFSGVYRSHVGDIELERLDVRTSTLGALADALNVMTGQLLLPPPQAPVRKKTRSTK